MNNYRRGAVFERQVCAALTGDGYLVLRSAGSHGVADLVALKPGQVVLIQCKIGGSITIADWNDLYTASLAVGALPVLAHKPRRGVIAYHVLCGPRQTRRPPPFTVWTPDELIN